MTEAMQKLSDPYRVQSGDTLSKIAKQSGTTVHDLMLWNGVRDPRKLKVDQTLYLSQASAFGVSAIFLDALRHPIENLPYRLQFDGKVVSGSTSANGSIPRQVTKDAKSNVELWVQGWQGQWSQVTSTTSDYGHKLITLVSPWVVVKGGTEPLPTGAPAVPTKTDKPQQSSPAGASTGVQKPAPAQATGESTKNNPSVKAKKVKGPQGQSVVQVSVEIPQGLLDLFAEYTGEEIKESDWKATADGLGCELEVLKAIAKVESGGRSAFWRLNRGDGASIPAILYERHYFSRLTKKKFDASHPDISWPTGYLGRKKAKAGDKNAKQPEGVVHDSDFYSDYASSYLRLINAFRLDADAALRSCSWGKFQVMGDNFSLCAVDNAVKFVTAMCTSELGQIQLLAGFIRKKPQAWKNPKNKTLGKEISLLDAVRNKDWKAIAFNYNGPKYAEFNYDHQIEAAYKFYKGSHA